VAAGLGQAIEAAASLALGGEPAIGDEARQCRAHLAVVELEALEQRDEIGQQNGAAARQDGVAEDGDDQRAGADRLPRGEIREQRGDRIGGARRQGRASVSGSGGLRLSAAWRDRTL